MSERSLILIGGGGHAKVVADCAESSGYTISGFVDDGESPMLAAMGFTHLGKICDLAKVLESFKRERPVVFHAIGDNRVRRELTESSMRQVRLAVEVGNLDCKGLAIVVHESAVISMTAVVGCGTLVGPHAVVNASSEIGEGVIVNSGAIVEHDCVVGSFAHIGPGAVLGGGVVVGEGTLIGLGARVLPGVCVGAGVVVGAGAVVCGDVEDGVVVRGVPGRVVE